MSDFDMMLQRKKSMSGKRRRNRDGGTFISDADDVVSAMIVKMNEAAEVCLLLSKACKDIVHANEIILNWIAGKDYVCFTELSTGVLNL